MTPTIGTIIAGTLVFGTYAYKELKLGQKFDQVFEKYVLRKDTFKRLPLKKKSRILALSIFVLSVDFLILSIMKGIMQFYLINLESHFKL